MALFRMSDKVREQIKARIIRKLVNNRIWGGKYTSHILGGLPRHLRKEAKQAIKELHKKHWILPKHKSEVLFYLNPEKAGEIKQFYEKHRNLNPQS